MLLKSLHLENILSYGSDGVDLELGPLNVLIGPNGSGKSNLIEIIFLLAATSRDIQEPLRSGGGLSEWKWKPQQSATPTAFAIGGRVASGDASIEAVFETWSDLITYRLVLPESFMYPRISGDPLLQETIQADSRQAGRPQFRFVYEDGKPIVYNDGQKKELPREALKPFQSVIGQLGSPLEFTALSWLARELEDVRFYREWSFGRRTPPRLPQPADARSDFLSEDGSNLGLILNAIRAVPEAKRKLLESLKRLYEGIDDFDVIVRAGAVQVFLQEGKAAIPATRLSDGTLRYLSLLAVLCHPTPPNLTCIEEPELGLHPDILPGLADLLKDASERTQLVITTHSDVLVDALSDTPEAVIVCDRHQGQTQLRRLDKARLHDWLEKYKLGELWRSGEIGGTRW